MTVRSDTQPIRNRSTGSDGPPKPGSSSSVETDLAGLSDRGKRRLNNEDHFLIGKIDRTWHKLESNLPARAVPETLTDTAYGLLVADGMGGHTAGETASRAAITTFVDLVLETPDLIMRLDPHFTEEALRRLDRRFQRIKDVLTEQVRFDESLTGMGTTMTLAATMGMEMLIAHVGDSRVYLFRNGGLQRLTRDQTLAQFLADTGMIEPEEIDRHPLRNTLTSALGTQGHPMDVDLRGLRLVDGDRVLLCTDGLTEMVSEAAIADVLRSTGRATAACRQLVDLALEAGGKDNVTVIVGGYREREET